MQKSGQVTVFVIVGLIALVSLFFIIALTPKNINPNPTQENYATFAQPVQFVAQDCAETVLHEAIFVTSSQGGYYKTPAPYIDYSYFQIPYYFDNTTLIDPAAAMVEAQIEQYLVENLPTCLERVPFANLNIEQQTPQPNIIIENEQVILDLQWPIDVEEGVSITTLSEFRVVEPVELGEALVLSQQILTEQERYPDVVRMSHLVALSEENDLYVELFKFNDTVIYALDYPNSSFSDEYVFTFAVRYPWQ